MSYRSMLKLTSLTPTSQQVFTKPIQLGEAKYILGIRIRREGMKILLDQANYIKNFLRDFQLDKANLLWVPIEGFEALTPPKLEKARTD